MEAAVIAVTALGFLALAAWVHYLFAAVHRALARHAGDLSVIRATVATTAADVIETQQISAETRSVLKEASRIKAARESVFEPRDTIPSGSRRYVPLALRRRMAEQASAGPATHKEQVRENNARAIETAG